MIRVRRIAIGVPLLVIAGIAAQGVFQSKVAGNLISAHWEGAQLGVINVIPADTPDATAYSVFWRGCTLNPDYEHRYCLMASGLAPKSAIRSNPSGGIALTLDLSMLSAIFSANMEDCRTGVCAYLPVASVPLNGTFTLYEGPGSFVDRANGSSSREDRLPFGGMTSQGFSGQRTRYSAVFAGTVGPLTVAPPAGAWNASITIMKGQQTFRTVYPPYPPMP